MPDTKQCIITEQLINKLNNSKQDFPKCSWQTIILPENPEIRMFNAMVLQTPFCSQLAIPNTMNIHTYNNYNFYNTEHNLKAS